MYSRISFMYIAPDKINGHELVRNATKKFDILFASLQTMKYENETADFSEFIFLLEAQLVSIYYKRIIQNLEIISTSQPQFLSFESKNELSDYALRRLMKVLSNYDHHDLSSLLKCTSLSSNENK